MESSQTSLPQKTRNKQNINFRLKRIELGPKQTTKKTDEMRSSKNGDKISIKKLLNSLHSKY